MTREVARRATIAAGLVLALGGCQTTVWTVGGPCPIWTEQAELELARLIERGDAKALEEAIGRQELYCQAIEPDTGAQCFGWGCWIWRLLQ